MDSNKSGNAKHRHHVVPRNYLRQWCIEKEDVLAVSINDTPPFLTSIDKVGYENQFYSYEQLTLEDIKSILKFRPRVAPDDLMRAFFHHTIVFPIRCRFVMDPSNNELIEIWRFLGASNLLIGNEEGEINLLYKAYLSDESEFLRKKNQLEKEGYENYLAKAEGRMWPILEKILKGHLGFIKSEKLSFRFFFYMVLQRTRSPIFMEIAKFDNATLNLSEDMLNSARYRRYVYAFDKAIQLTMSRSDFTFRLLRNTSSLEYVTGDLPVVEILQREKTADYFFPVSPMLALVWGPRKGFDSRFQWLDPSKREVIDRLNREICRQSLRQIYATTPDVLSDNDYVAKGDFPKMAEAIGLSVAGERKVLDKLKAPGCIRRI